MGRIWKLGGESDVVDADVVAALDALRTDILMSRGAARVGINELSDRLRAVSAQLRRQTQEDALSCAQQAQLQASHCLPLLQRAALEEEGATLRAEVNVLSATATEQARASSKHLLKRLGSANNMGSSGISFSDRI